MADDRGWLVVIEREGWKGQAAREGKRRDRSGAASL